MRLFGLLRLFALVVELTMLAGAWGAAVLVDHAPPVVLARTAAAALALLGLIGVTEPLVRRLLRRLKVGRWLRGYQILFLGGFGGWTLLLAGGLSLALFTIAPPPVYAGFVAFLGYATVAMTLLMAGTYLILAVWATSTREYIVGQAVVQVPSFVFVVLGLVLARAAGRLAP